MKILSSVVVLAGALAMTSAQAWVIESDTETDIIVNQYREDVVFEREIVDEYGVEEVDIELEVIEYFSPKSTQPIAEISQSLINYMAGIAGLVVITDQAGGVLCINNIRSDMPLNEGVVHILRGGWTETLYSGLLTYDSPLPVLMLTQQFVTHDDMDGDKIYEGWITYIGQDGRGGEIWSIGAMTNTCQMKISEEAN